MIGETLLEEWATRESIEYTCGHMNFNECTHLRERRNIKRNVIRYYDASGNHIETNWYGPNSEASIPDIVSVSTPSQAQLSQFVYDRLVPSMSSGFTGLNFLWELRDLDRMFTIFSRSLTLRRNAGNLALSTKYGWLPFIGDIKKLRKGLQTFDARLQKIKAEAGKLIRRRGRYPLKLDAEGTVQVNHDVPQQEYITKYTLNVEQSKVISEMYYSLPDLTDAEIRVRALLDTLGTHLDAATIWEAIPYSFVIDWFIDVGKFLGTYRDKYLEVVTTFTRCMFDAKVKIEAHTYGTYEGQDLGCISHLERTLFLRIPFMPNIDPRAKTLDFKSMTAKKFAWGSLLSLQRSKKW